MSNRADMESAPTCNWKASHDRLFLSINPKGKENICNLIYIFDLIGVNIFLFNIETNSNNFDLFTGFQIRFMVFFIFYLGNCFVCFA